jgi:hypothetical protein
MPVIALPRVSTPMSGPDAPEEPGDLPNEKAAV